MTGEHSAASWADEMVAAVRDDPAARLTLMERCYHGPFGDASGHLPFRRAAVSFMRWQLRRGVLQPPFAARPGSPWWRAVNERIVRDGCEAVALSGNLPGPPSSASVDRWMSFVDRPTARAAPRLALGWLSPVAPFVGNPRLGMVGIFLQLSRVLPDEYPLRDRVGTYLDHELGLGRLMDYGVIVPRLQPLYEWSARELGATGLVDCVREGAMTYAWSFEDRGVWRPPDSRLVRLVQRVLPPLATAVPSRADGPNVELAVQPVGPNRSTRMRSGGRPASSRIAPAPSAKRADPHT